MNIHLGQNITNYKVGRQKFGISSLLVLSLIGAIFVGVGVLAIRLARIDPTWTRSTGEVVDVTSRISDGSTLYSPIVQYTVNGQSYTIVGSVSSSSYPRIGEKREVAYNPSRLDQAKVVEGAGMQMILYLFPLIGIICLASAPYSYIRSSKRDSTIRRLMQTGHKAQGVLVDVQADGNTNSNRFKIVVSATDMHGTVQNYVSDSLDGVGGLAMADFRNNPIPIDVYIDPVNPKNYYVDIADIPNLTPARIVELIKRAAQNKQVSTFADDEKPSTTPTDPILPPSHM